MGSYGRLFLFSRCCLVGSGNRFALSGHPFLYLLFTLLYTFLTLPSFVFVLYGRRETGRDKRRDLAFFSSFLFFLITRFGVHSPFRHWSKSHCFDCFLDTHHTLYLGLSAFPSSQRREASFGFFFSFSPLLPSYPLAVLPLCLFRSLSVFLRLRYKHILTLFLTLLLPYYFSILVFLTFSLQFNTLKAKLAAFPWSSSPLHSLQNRTLNDNLSTW